MSKIYLCRLAQWVSNGLPPRVGVRLAEQLADLQWRRAAHDRAAVQSNLRVVLNHSAADDGSMVREVFRNFARYLVEFLTAHRPRHAAITIEGTERVVSAIRPLQGCIILSGHLGNWELGAIALRRLGFPISSVVLPHQDPRVNLFFNEQRFRCGVGAVPLGIRAAQRCIELLRAGRQLAVLGDREFGQHALPVSFFGRRCAMPRGPALLSLRTGVPVIPVFFIREGLWRFRFYVEAPIYPVASRPPSSAQGREGQVGSHGGALQDLRTHDQVLQLTQAYVKVIERYIQRFPSQWLMFQPLFDETDS